MSRPDPVLLVELTRAVQNALVADATARLQSGRGRLGRGGQEALADKVLRQELQRIDTDRLAAGAPRLTADEERALVERVLALSVGLGPVELLLADESVEEVVATRFDLVFVYRSDGSVEQLEERLWASEAEMESWLAHLARTAGRTERQFNAQVAAAGDAPRRRAAPGGHPRRVPARVVRPAPQHARQGHAGRPGRLGHAARAGRRSCWRRACARREIRLVFSGPTGSGKSTLVRACLAELRPLARVVIIEDTAELDLFDPLLHPNVESWEARLANNEGEGAITPGQQVKHALRYRPDWLVFGEVRDSDGAVPMLKAMTHGQSSLTTVHSATALGALDKLALYLGTGEDRLPPEVAHHQLHQAVDFVVHLDRLPDGRRVVTEMLEVAGFDGRRCTTNTLAVRDPATGDGRDVEPARTAPPPDVGPGRVRRRGAGRRVPMRTAGRARSSACSPPPACGWPSPVPPASPPGAVRRGRRWRGSSCGGGRRSCVGAAVGRLGGDGLAGRRCAGRRGRRGGADAGRDPAAPRDRLNARSEALAVWAEMLRDTIAAHAGLREAIAVTARVAPLPIRAEVQALAVRAEREPLTVALRRFAVEVADPVADLIVAALVIAADRQAHRLAELLSQIAAAAREQAAMRIRVETGRARTYASSRALVAITFGLAVVLLRVLADVHGALRHGHRPGRAGRHRRPVRRCAVGPRPARPARGRAPAAGRHRARRHEVVHR